VDVERYGHGARRGFHAPRSAGGLIEVGFGGFPAVDWNAP
jgi:hypothetical protein